jgi:hypothetical protein
LYKEEKRIKGEKNKKIKKIQKSGVKHLKKIKLRGIIHLYDEIILKRSVLTYEIL